MPSDPASGSAPVLVVGATGDLGGRVVGALRARGKTVRALVRPGSDATGLPKEGVEVVRGDMLDPSSLGPAMAGVSALISTAIGYSGRRAGDSLRTDFEGNRHLVDAARQSGVPRFVFLSILACDQAPDVPHFWAKKVTEDYLVAQGVPFVALRPGAFLTAPPGRYRAWMVSGLEKGRVMAMTPAGIRITYIAPDEVARALALAVDEPRALGQRIDLGSDRPLSGPELADLVGRLLGRKMEARSMGGGFLMKLIAAFSPRMRDMGSMVRFFQTGRYVADTRRQAELFGPVPSVEEAARRMLAELGLRPNRSPG
ncbi:MAG TPA: SDR family oxidoreductase [Thermoplasmata archaeon]|nr:SDR family oxidoreductase [Thermoplasmata archaeon]